MIYLCLAHMSEEGLEQKYVKEAFDTNWVVPLGPNVNGFEADLKSLPVVLMRWWLCLQVRLLYTWLCWLVV